MFLLYLLLWMPYACLFTFYDSIVCYGIAYKRTNKSKMLWTWRISNLFKIELMYAHLFIRKPKVTGMIMMTLTYLVRILLRNFYFSHLLLCCLQKRSIGSVVIFVEFPTWHWYFDLLLSATMVTTQAAKRVYIFHDFKFCALVMRPFFSLHDPFDDISLFAMHPPFHPPNRKRRWILTHAWCRHTPSSLIIWSLPIRPDLTDFRVIFFHVELGV